MVFIKAKVGPPNIGDPSDMFSVQYFDENGNLAIRSGGTRAWRCNNPGNLIKSPYSMGKDRKAIGSAGDGKNEYAVYPDYQTGHQALIVMLRGSKYSPLSLRAAIKRFDKTNPKYIDEIIVITHFDPERTIKSLSDTEFEIFWEAIERIEKWKVGREDFIEKWVIVGVHKKQGVITEYLVQTSSKPSWIPKPRAVTLALEGKLHASIVRLKERYYLRPEYGAQAFLKIV